MKKCLFLLLLIVLVFLQMTNAQTPVAYYPFNGNANDAAGTNNGTVNGAILTTDRFGNVNSAYSFDGVDDNITINNSATFNFPNSLTISLWVKYNGAGTAGKSIWSLISKNFNGNGNEDQFHIWVNATDKSTGGRFGTGPDLVGFGGLPAIDNGLWHQIQVVFDNPNNVINHYLDGVLISTAANTANVFNNGSAIRIGYWEAFNNFFNGAIDEVKIYNTALTAAQVQQEYLSTNNYSSQFGNSVQMNGANDQIDIAAIPNLQEFTVEMWVKPGSSQTNSANIIDNNHANNVNWVCQQENNMTNRYCWGVNSCTFFDLQPNIWQHLVLQKTTTSHSVFINGVLVSTTSSSAINYSNPSFIRLGNYAGGGRNWNGSMDEVRIWNTVRTQSEIVANMNQQLTGNEAGLIAYWDMNRNGQGAGLTVDNKCVATGATLNGTTVGTASTPIFAQGITQQKPGSGNAISFDGVDDHITATAYVVPTTGDFTVDFWVFNRSNTGFREFISQGASGDAFYIGLDASGTGSMRCGDNWQVTGAILPLNKWIHVSMTKTGTNATLYLNGMQVAAQTGYTISAAGTTTVIGKQYGSITEFPDASLDELRVWNTALTQTQIRDRMCRKVTATDALYSNLVAYYNFDESSGNTLFDGTANANNGALTNSPTRVTSGAAIGNASSHDYVNATKTASLTHPTGESFTVTSTSGNPDAIHVYRVDEKPSDMTGATGVGANDKYFGVFQVNGTTPQYTAVYNYNGNPAINAGNESPLRLNKRTDNAATSWSTMAALPNEAANTITVTGESTEYILGSIGIPLPLNLISFIGNKQNRDALLQWKTVNEVNVSRFELQRSENGQNFVTIGSVSAGGNNYSYTDAGVFNTKQTVYYRLKSVDMDGRFTQSSIIRLQKTSTGLITVFPNPATDKIAISGLKQSGTVRLYDGTGKLLQQQVITAQTVTMDMSGYAKGMYLLQYVVEGEISNLKIIRQ